MNIKWSYCLIAVIYVLLIILRGINYKNSRDFKKKHEDWIKAFSIKKDFFTAVMTACILVTITINIAAVYGGRPVNKQSIIITLCVIGLTLLNSFSDLLISEKKKSVFFCGYCLQKGDISASKVKQGKIRYKFSVAFNKDIDSYNYAKILVFGKNKDKIEVVLKGLIAEKQQKE